MPNAHIIGHPWLPVQSFPRTPVALTINPLRAGWRPDDASIAGYSGSMKRVQRLVTNQCGVRAADPRKDLGLEPISKFCI